MEERQPEQRQSAQVETPEKVNTAQQNRMAFDGPALSFKRLPRVGDTLTLNGRVIGFCRAAQLGKGKGIDAACAIEPNQYLQARSLARMINSAPGLFKLRARHDGRRVIVEVIPGEPYPQEVVKNYDNGGGDQPGDNGK